MKTIKAAVILSALLIAGCSAPIIKSEGARIDKALILNLKTGSTTKAEALEAFGTPNEVRAEHGEEKLLYVFNETVTPTYLGGLVENKLKTERTTATLELILKDSIVYSYNFKTTHR
ncbi:MAG: hypothetical protein HY886_05100 [Deltaproteobacteria bacterium]|nr:hypothetical protein [Deltaproteobacteria bacterium]